MPFSDPIKRAESDRMKMRAHRARYRTRVLMFLGGRCSTCGNNDSRVLQLDHKDGGGNRDRKSGPTMNSIGAYHIGRLALAHPEKFQVLCANCNWIKRFERGEHGGVKPTIAIGG